MVSSSSRPPEPEWEPVASRYGYGGTVDYLCLQKSFGKIELAVCGHGWLAEVPSEWFDDDGVPLSAHQDKDGGLRLPLEWEGEVVTGVEEGFLTGELIADDQMRIDVTDYSTESLTQALSELFWEEAILEDLRSAILLLEPKATNDPRLNLPILHPKYTSAAIPPAANWHDGSGKFLSVWRLSDNRISIAIDPRITDVDWWGSSLAKIVDASHGLADMYLEHLPERDGVRTRILAGWSLNQLDIRKDRDIQVASRDDWDLDADATEILAAWNCEGQMGAISGSLHWANPGAWGRVLAAVVEEVAQTMAEGDRVVAADIAVRIRRAADERFRR